MIHHGNPHEQVSNPGKAIARMPKIQRQLQLLDATRHCETFRQKARMNIHHMIKKTAEYIQMLQKHIFLLLKYDMFLLFLYFF